MYQETQLGNIVTSRKFLIHSDFVYSDFLLKSLPSQCQEYSEPGIFFAFSNCLTSVYIKRPVRGTSLAVQCLRLCSSNAEGVGSIPDWGTKIPKAAWWGRRKKSTQKSHWKVASNIWQSFFLSSETWYRLIKICFSPC